MKTNNIIKVIAFVIFIGLCCLLFFGLGEAKTELQIVGFSFMMFAALTVCLSAILPSMFNTKKLEVSDFVSISIMYAMVSFFINQVFLNDIAAMKDLIIYNVSAILVFILILCFVIINKKQK